MPTPETEGRNQAIAKRQDAEKRIVTELVRELLNHGFYLSTDNGEDDMCPVSNREKSVLDGLFQCDEEFIRVLRKYDDGAFKLAGTILLVYGNDGWDVIADYHTSLEPFMKSTQELAESIMEEEQESNG